MFIVIFLQLSVELKLFQNKTLKVTEAFGYGRSYGGERGRQAHGRLSG